MEVFMSDVVPIEQEAREVTHPDDAMTVNDVKGVIGRRLKILDGKRTGNTQKDEFLREETEQISLVVMWIGRYNQRNADATLREAWADCMNEEPLDSEPKSLELQREAAQTFLGTLWAETGGELSKLSTGDKLAVESARLASEKKAENSQRESDEIFRKQMEGPVSIDEEVEKKYRNFQEYLLSLEPDRLKEWFVEYFNRSIKPGNHLLPLEVSSLSVEADSPELGELRKRYGKEYQRPFLSLYLAEFKRFSAKLRGRTDSNGFCTRGEIVDEDPLTNGLGVIVGAGLTRETIHELKHSIDPYYGKRKGPNQVIEEYVAFMEEVLVPTRHTATVTDSAGNVTIQERIISKKISGLRKILKLKIYFEQYNHLFEGKEQYEATIDGISDAVESLLDFYSNEEIDRVLMNSRGVEDIERLVQIKQKSSNSNE